MGGALIRESLGVFVTNVRVASDILWLLSTAALWTKRLVWVGAGQGYWMGIKHCYSCVNHSRICESLILWPAVAVDCGDRAGASSIVTHVSRHSSDWWLPAAAMVLFVVIAMAAQLVASILAASDVAFGGGIWPTARLF